MDVGFGDQLRRHRLAAELTQEQLAEAAALSSQAVGSLERGERRFPRPDTVRRLSAALGLTVDQRAALLAASRRRPATDPGPPAGPVEPRPPHELPARLPGFTGRTGLLAAVADHLRSSAGLAVVAVSGMGGVGKTALAVEVGHRVAADFPDGQIFLDLGGTRARPPRPEELLGQVLRAFHLGGGPVDDVAEGGARYRSALAGRRVLLVLDDAAGTDQVRPLLPGGDRAAVLVTSRRTLVALPGARHEQLDVLSAREALDLLGTVVGRDRVAAEAAEARALVGYCGRLPLAVHLAGARLATRPGWPVGHLAALLADRETRLDRLDVDGSAVRTGIAVTVEALAAGPDPLDRAAARAFPLLGLLASPTLDGAVVAALLGVDRPAAEQVLGRLADLHLVEAAEPDRYRMHDLVQAHVRAGSARSADPGTAAGLARLLGCYAVALWRAQRLMYSGGVRGRRAARRWPDEPGAAAGLPAFADGAAALAWLHREEQNIVAAVVRADHVAAVPRDLLVRVGLGTFAYFTSHGGGEDWERVCAVALRAAEAGTEAGTGAGTGAGGDAPASDPWIVATARMDLGMARHLRVHATGGDLGAGIALVRRSLAEFVALGDRAGQAVCLANLSHLLETTGDLPAAIACAEQGLAALDPEHDAATEAATRENLGTLLLRTGEVERAATEYERSIRLAEAAGDDRAAAGALRLLGPLRAEAGRYDEAVTMLGRSVVLADLTGDGHGLVAARHRLGAVHLRRGDRRTADAELRAALALAHRHGTPGMVAAISGDLRRAGDRPDR